MTRSGTMTQGHGSDAVGSWWADGSVAAAVTALSCVVALTLPEASATPPGAIGLALLAVAGATLVWRRRWPVPVLLAVLLVTQVYLVLDRPGGAELPLVALGVFTVAASGRRWWAAGITAVTVANGVGYRVLVEGQPVVLVVYTAVPLVLVALLGDAVWLRRRLRDEARDRERRLADERERETQARLAAEQLRIARELHDVLAHTITTVTVQAGAVADGLDPRDPAREVLRSMRDGTREAMSQLQATIAVLRAGASDRRPAPGLAQLSDLLDGVRDAGLDVEVVGASGTGPPAAGLPAGLPAAVDLTAYRVLQEALTNVLRHARTDRASITVDRGADRLRLVVDDDGTGDGPRRGEGDGAGVGGTGFGLIGMRERVHALGGRLEAGPRPGRGYRVTAELPLVSTAAAPSRDQVEPRRDRVDRGHDRVG